MRNTFNTALATANTSAQRTLSNAMVEWWMATDKEDALRQINAQPGSDLAGIENSVVSGLTKAADLLVCDLDALVSERDLTPLANLSADDIVEVLDAIHLQWIEDNLTAKRWAEKFFKKVLGQYRKTAKLPWDEVAKDLLFVQEYLTAGGCTVTVAEIASAFAEAAEFDSEDDDLPVIAERARTLAGDIIPAILAFREKSAKKPALVAEIDAFLEAHTDPAEIMEIMISSI